MIRMTKLKHIIALFVIIFSSSACEKVDLNDPNASLPAPSELLSQKISATAVKLSWKDNSKGEQGFVIERTILGTTNTVEFKVSEDTEEWIDETVLINTYRYKVYAYYKTKKSEPIAINYQHTPVSSVRNLKITDQTTQLKLSWDLPTEVFDQVLIERKINQGAFSIYKSLSNTANEFIDKELQAGTITYRVTLVSGNYKSEPTDASLVFVALPSVELRQLLQSNFVMSADVLLTNDGGETASVGLCWNTTGNPTIADQQLALSQKLSTGQLAIVNVSQLLKNTNYSVRAFATNSKGTSYSTELSGMLKPEPAAIQLQWTAMNQPGLPAEIKLYETSSSLNGRNFKAYYSIADMSTGNIELKTIFSSTAKKPSQFVSSTPNETFYMLTNAGYFGYQGAVAVSYSLVVDRGSKQADNIQALTRGAYTYQVTRGAFGVNQQQQASLKWIFGNYAYNTPSANTEGELPQPHPNATFPEVSNAWSPYTAIGGAPVLLHNGNVVFDLLKTSAGKFRTNYELLQSDIFSETARPPRTVIGRTADHKIVLFVCDGRQSHSDGATLLELAQILKGLGCVDALNLDGGGSSAILAGSTVLNKPSDGTERAVPSVVGFVRRK